MGFAKSINPNLAEEKSLGLYYSGQGSFDLKSLE